ncbi:zinc-finger domain-containing protein [Cytobacillus purgationiresistens]|uniref:Zinc-finger domain-containing protein n=1 Tax=Cytobacillus purgationiresistens TaxID=863449 RepID=A0ABU0ANR4_9BACI|nr:zinc-finger domain-containing protein [Cytobacillus purgationiresistens]MDQ0272043.1 hypothetical protein [Cytobacillus purgationiresistens]
MEKKKIVQEVGSLMGHYCEECFLYKHHRKEKGRNFAHRFCISECTVGQKIKSIGKKLS